MFFKKSFLHGAEYISVEKSNFWAKNAGSAPTLV